jgi:hypothetical protein
MMLLTHILIPVLGVVSVLALVRWLRGSLDKGGRGDP